MAVGGDLTLGSWPRGVLILDQTRKLNLQKSLDFGSIHCTGDVWRFGFLVGFFKRRRVEKGTRTHVQGAWYRWAKILRSRRSS